MDSEQGPSHQNPDAGTSMELSIDDLGRHDNEHRLKMRSKHWLIFFRNLVNTIVAVIAAAIADFTPRLLVVSILNTAEGYGEIFISYWIKSKGRADYERYRNAWDENQLADHQIEIGPV